jgi:hypothetical protein
MPGRLVLAFWEVTVSLSGEEEEDWGDEGEEENWEEEEWSEEEGWTEEEEW